MQITIYSERTDPDDTDDLLVRYEFRAASDDFMGTSHFYGYPDVFKDFAAQIRKIPFETKEPAIFEADELRIKVSLYDQAGAICFSVEITDEDNNSVSFKDNTIETMQLERLANNLDAADFSKESTFNWSNNYDRK